VTSRIIRILFILLPAFYINAASSAQLLSDSGSYELIRKGVDYVYNFQFDEAEKVYSRLKQLYPEHPIPFLYRGLLTFWKNYPLLANSPSRLSFEDDMNTTIRICEEAQSQKYEAEFLMANLAARGMLLLFYSDNDITKEVIPLASSTYKYVKRAFDYKESFKDFYFITGLYNYYRETYPEVHPVYRSIAFLFPEGNREEGLRDLNLAARQSIFLKAEAYSFLSGIYISFENDFKRAGLYSEQLHDLYPENPLYIALYIKNLLLIKEYDKAEQLINKAKREKDNDYLKVQLTILNGILYEKKYGNLRAAKSSYRSGIERASKYSDYADEYVAYAYFGLSRISEAEDDQQAARNYRRLALDKTAYDNVNFD
jgi:hypothetical protein